MVRTLVEQAGGELVVAVGLAQPKGVLVVVYLIGDGVNTLVVNQLEADALGGWVGRRTILGRRTRPTHCQQQAAH